MAVGVEVDAQRPPEPPCQQTEQLQPDSSSQSVELSAALSVVPQLVGLSVRTWRYPWYQPSVVLSIWAVTGSVRGAESPSLHCTVHLAFILRRCPWC